MYVLNDGVGGGGGHKRPWKDVQTYNKKILYNHKVAQIMCKKIIAKRRQRNKKNDFLKQTGHIYTDTVWPFKELKK